MPDEHGRFKGISVPTKAKWPPSKNVCPKCRSDRYAELRDHSAIWGDGEMWCRRCEIKIRDWDSG